MSKASNYIIIDTGPPKRFKEASLPESYKATMYNQFAMVLGKGHNVDIRVDPEGNSMISIGRIELASPPEMSKKYVIGVDLDDGSIYLECKMLRYIKMGAITYRIILTSNQPPKTWINKSK